MDAGLKLELLLAELDFEIGVCDELIDKMVATSVGAGPQAMTRQQRVIALMQAIAQQTNPQNLPGLCSVLVERLAQLTLERDEAGR